MRIVRVALAMAGLLVPVGIIAAQSPPVGRILGVFDDATGRPVGGVEVLDLATGSKMLTSETGTISLSWLSAGSTFLRVRKLGYMSKLQPVAVSPTDTVSITMVLVPVSQQLPAVMTTGAAAGDTVRGLQLNGFYERRRSSGAPSHAFITADQLRQWNVNYLGDLKTRTGRGVCGEVYVDGLLINGGVWLGPGDSASKPRVDVDVVVGIETYFGAELPAQFNKTRPTRGELSSRTSRVDRCAATLIWTR
jgi:hypothetical protein